MTDIEFEKQAKRAAIAFNLPSSIFIKIEILPYYTDQIICASFKSEKFDLVICYRESKSRWSFDLMKGHDVLECEDWPDDPSIYAENDVSRFLFVMARGIYLFGFDTRYIEDWFNLTITAHQKLEWQLEFQRRLREETSQVD